MRLNSFPVENDFQSQAAGSTLASLFFWANKPNYYGKEFGGHSPELSLYGHPGRFIQSPGVSELWSVTSLLSSARDLPKHATASSLPLMRTGAPTFAHISKGFRRKALLQGLGHQLSYLF
ncbi:hypothetical protein JTE90_011570 [Oedothorax gibbosus]|uniref:Uncharacterized protein n=1 Tax=Oedothorax gibbosus TaxID=931172 RepID=A0AAV6UKV5_9ARAC|nr:hypothetical protein JTE90_011570 [Oedothorax gibbosus]